MTEPPAHEGLFSSLRNELDRLERAVEGTAIEPVARAAPWQRPYHGDHRLTIDAVILVAVALQLVLPANLVLGPVVLLPALELALLVGITAASPGRINRSSRLSRSVSLLVIASISFANAWSAALLIEGLVRGSDVSGAPSLLGRGAAIYATNIIVFGLWYWELDRGGPAARAQGLAPYPDFLFPQQSQPDLAPPEWRPGFVDYLWLSYTNATAFSPTDIMPLSRWAKQLMFLQSAVSLTTVALVVARAVNILR